VILVILLGVPLFAVAAFAAVMVHLAIPWLIASLLFAPCAGRIYERAATAAGVQQDPRLLRRSGMIAGALLIVPWVYMMRRLKGQRTGSWIFHPRTAYLLWLLAPTVFFLVISALLLLDDASVTVWIYAAVAAAPCSILTLLRVAGAPRLPPPYQPASLVRPYAWTAFWTLIAILLAALLFIERGRPFLIIYG
jgi:hypothetical protein